MRKFSSALAFLLVLSSSTAFAGGAPAASGPKFDWKESQGIQSAANEFVAAVVNGQYDVAYQLGGETLRKERSLEAFTADLKDARLDQGGTIEWNNGTQALPAANGFKLMGNYTASNGTTFPVYMHLEGDAHVEGTIRNRQWNENTKWTVLDYRSSESMFSRLNTEHAKTLDWVLLVFAIVLVLALVGLTFGYVRGLQGHPRELWLMFFTKLTEYSAYGSASVIFVLFLQQEVTINGQALGDSTGYLYYAVWGLVATIITVMVGAVCDTIGVKQCLLIGSVMLLISRFAMPLTNDIIPVTILGFLPLAFGFAITGPVLKVGIKWFTTLKTATLGFGLFYTLMNVGFTIGAELADYFRKYYADGLEIWGVEMSCYQLIIAIGFLINIPDLIAILIMREGAEMTEKGMVIRKPETATAAELEKQLQDTLTARRAKMTSEFLKSLGATALIGLLAYFLVEFELHKWVIAGVVKAGNYVWAIVVTLAIMAIGGILYAAFSHFGTLKPGGAFDRVMKSVRDATEETGFQLKDNFTQKVFWIYMGMLGILTFVKLTFYLFHVMFPTYATRVFGYDFPVAGVFGTLNPAMIVFLVPLISALTVNIRSYTMLMVGTAVSAGAVFLCFLPDSVALAIGDTWFGTWLFDYWLEAPAGSRDPFLVSFIIFIMVFTVGEAIWSPRLMQFSAEIAPKGKEGAYIALAMLPYFLGKIAATVMADILTTKYFSSEMVAYPDHEISWLWVAGMCLLSPIGMFIWRKHFNHSEKAAEEEAEAIMAAELGDQEPASA